MVLRWSSPAASRWPATLATRSPSSGPCSSSIVDGDALVELAAPRGREAVDEGLRDERVDEPEAPGRVRVSRDERRRHRLLDLGQQVVGLLVEELGEHVELEVPTDDRGGDEHLLRLLAEALRRAGVTTSRTLAGVGSFSIEVVSVHTPSSPRAR